MKDVEIEELRLKIE